MLNSCVSKLTGAFLQEDDLGLWEEVWATDDHLFSPTNQTAGQAGFVNLGELLSWTLGFESNNRMVKCYLVYDSQLQNKWRHMTHIMYHHIYFVNTSLTNSAKNLQCFLNAHMLIGVCRFIWWYHTRMWEYMCLRVCATLTTFHRNRGSLQRQHLPIGLRDVHSKHHTDTRVLPSYICLPFSKLNIWIPQFKDAGTVDTARQRAEKFGLGSTNVHKKYWGRAGIKTVKLATRLTEDGKTSAKCPWLLRTTVNE